MKGIIPEIILGRNDKSIPAALFLGKELKDNTSLKRQWLSENFPGDN